MLEADICRGISLWEIAHSEKMQYLIVFWGLVRYNIGSDKSESIEEGTCMKIGGIKFTKAVSILASVLLIGTSTIGCSKQLVSKISEETTIFDSLQVDEQNGTIVSKGKVKIHEADGVLLTIEAGESGKGIFNISYTKDEGSLQVNQDDKLILSLGDSAETETNSDDISVELKKGRNDFIISGEDCECEFTVSFNIADKSQIISFGGGSLK